MKIAAVGTLLLTAWLAVNWVYQVVRKPSELLFPVSATLYKTPVETWRDYSVIFGRYATPVITGDLLAAMAQVEGSGNPLARTYWRWSWTMRPFAVYRPASSAVGMYQITDGTFAAARRTCLRAHTTAPDGPGRAQSCEFNSLSARLVPAQAIELTAAYLDRSVASIVARRRSNATLAQKQNLAAVIHLCGAGAGDGYARHGFRSMQGQRCGDQDVHAYLARVTAMKRVFARLGAAQSAPRAGVIPDGK